MERRALARQNLDFFKRWYPDVHLKLESLRPTRSLFCAHEKQGVFDLRVDGKSAYGGDMAGYANREVDLFLEAYAIGGIYRTVRPTQKRVYVGKRVFGRAINKVVEASPIWSEGCDGGEFIVPQVLPLCLVLGVGYHLKLLGERRTIQHLVLVEDDIERLYASLFYLDWMGLKEEYSGVGKSFSFVAEFSGVERDSALYKSLWNLLSVFTPIFPVGLFIYNHLANPFYNGLVCRLKTEMVVNFQSWGQFDDELNQLNNALHNLSNKKNKILKSRESLPDFSDVAVCIVGSGPSLDARINDLVQLSKHALVISCGTALQALHKRGIAPDYHVEIESHLATWESSVKRLFEKDPSYLKSIALIAAVQVHPYVCNAFGSAHLYFKDSSALAGFCGDLNRVISHATPTCTNSALAISSFLGVGRIFLFGCDFGFTAPDRHHAEGTIYGDDDASDYIKEHVKAREQCEEKKHIKIDGIGGEDILTSPIYFSALKRLENGLFNYLKNFEGRKVFNCSEGANIKFAPYGSSAEIGAQIVGLKKAHGLGGLSISESVGVEKVSNGKVRLASDYVRLVGGLTSLLAEWDFRGTQTIEGLFVLGSKMVAMVNTGSGASESYLYLLRGSIWHWLYLGFTHALSLSGDARSDFLSSWSFAFIGFLRDSESCLLGRLEGEVLNRDPWLALTVDQAVAT